MSGLCQCLANVSACTLAPRRAIFLVLPLIVAPTSTTRGRVLASRAPHISQGSALYRGTSRFRDSNLNIRSEFSAGSADTKKVNNKGVGMKVWVETNYCCLLTSIKGCMALAGWPPAAPPSVISGPSQLKCPTELLAGSLAGWLGHNDYLINLSTHYRLDVINY